MRFALSALCPYTFDMKRWKTPIRYTLLTAVTLTTGGCLGPWYDRQKAVDCYVQAVSLSGEDFDDQAIAQLEKAVRLDGEFWLAHSLLGDLYSQQGAYGQAVKAYGRACELDPWSFDDHYKLGGAWRHLQEYPQAIDALRRACQLRPDHAMAHFDLGRCFYQTGDYEQAQRYCQQAAELDPKNDAILAGLGDVYSRQGKGYEAIRAYKQALELNPNDDRVMMQLGLVYVNMDRLEPGRVMLEKAVTAAPNKGENLLNLGYCLIKQRLIDQAMAVYRQGPGYSSRESYLACTTGWRYAGSCGIRDDRDNADAAQARGWSSGISPWRFKPDQEHVFGSLLARYRQVCRIEGTAKNSFWLRLAAMAASGVGLVKSSSR